MNKLNKHSQRLTQDESQPASQAMLYAVGLTDEDMQKAQVGIASTGYDGNPCNMHLNRLKDEVKIECKIADMVTSSVMPSFCPTHHVPCALADQASTHRQSYL